MRHKIGVVVLATMLLLAVCVTSAEERHRNYVSQGAQQRSSQQPNFQQPGFNNLGFSRTSFNNLSISSTRSRTLILRSNLIFSSGILKPRI